MSICALGGFALSGFAAIAVLLFVFLPVIVLLLLLVKLLFRVKWRMWPLFIVMHILWLVSVVCIICNMAEIVPKFSHKATLNEMLETLPLVSSKQYNLLIINIYEQNYIS